MSDQSPRLIPFFLSIPISLPPLLLHSLLSFYLSHFLFLPFHSPRLALFYFCFLFPSLLPSYLCFLLLLPFLSPSCFPFSPIVLFFLPSPLFPFFSLLYSAPFLLSFSISLSLPISSSLSCPLVLPSTLFSILFPLYLLSSTLPVLLAPVILSLIPSYPFSIYLLIFSGYVSSLFTFSSFIRSLA